MIGERLRNRQMVRSHTPIVGGSGGGAAARWVTGYGDSPAGPPQDVGEGDRRGGTGRNKCYTLAGFKVVFGC